MSFTKATADAVVTSFNALTDDEKHYVAIRLRNEAPILFQTQNPVTSDKYLGGGTWPKGA